MSANKFVLKGSGVEVDYTIGASFAIPALVYTDGAFQKKFKPNEIVSEDTSLGQMVSVALILAIDAGGERFGREAQVGAKARSYALRHSCRDFRADGAVAFDQSGENTQQLDFRLVGVADGTAEIRPQIVDA